MAKRAAKSAVPGEPVSKTAAVGGVAIMTRGRTKAAYAKLATALRKQLVSDLARVINHHSLENGSDTPDFLLAEYLVDCLEAYERVTGKTRRWCGDGPRWRGLAAALGASARRAGAKGAKV